MWVMGFENAAAMMPNFRLKMCVSIHVLVDHLVSDGLLDHNCEMGLLLSIVTFLPTILMADGPDSISTAITRSQHDLVGRHLPLFSLSLSLLKYYRKDGI